MDYSLSSDVWNFPADLYTIDFRIQQDDFSKLVSFVMIDTVVLCNLFDQNYRNKLNMEYYTKLLKKIESIQSMDLIFLVGHHPIYTTMKGRKYSSCLHENLLRIMKLYSIKTYIGNISIFRIKSSISLSYF